jgi:hypothetical protein
MIYDQLTTVICTTSPSPCHPDTRMINETLRSVRHWFPNSIVRILCDGVRPELAHRETAYRDYTAQLQARQDSRTVLDVFGSHLHQTAMVKNVLPCVDTPLILWIEHDLPMRTDVDIEWQMMADAIMAGCADVCRLMLTESVHPDHLHLYQGQIPGWPRIWKQRQWSGWTHLASTDMYRRLLRDYDYRRGLLMVENYAQRIIETHPWEDFKLTSYIPDPAAARRIYHLHGRGGVDGGPDDPSFVAKDIYRYA